MNAWLKEKMTEYTAITDEALKSYLEQGDMPALLRDSMSYSLFAGGKRLRPCLTLASCELAGGKIQDALPAACALEMIHTYSLIHDDLPAMDNDDMRRGKPSNHKVFGEGHAILAGDGLLSFAFEILLDECRKNKIPAQAAYAIAKGAGVYGMVAGQSLDLCNENNIALDASALKNIHARKTGAMLLACVEAGAYCANADKKMICALKAYGEYYGQLFQLTDDILDVTGEKEKMGKTLGKDAQTGKVTWVSLLGLENAKQKAEKIAFSAKQTMEDFKEQAKFFYELIDYTLERSS